MDEHVATWKLKSQTIETFDFDNALGVAWTVEFNGETIRHAVRVKDVGGMPFQASMREAKNCLEQYFTEKFGAPRGF